MSNKAANGSTIQFQKDGGVDVKEGLKPIEEARFLTSVIRKMQAALTAAGFELKEVRDTELERMNKKHPEEVLLRTGRSSDDDTVFVKNVEVDAKGKPVRRVLVGIDDGVFGSVYSLSLKVETLTDKTQDPELKKWRLQQFVQPFGNHGKPLPNAVVETYPLAAISTEFKWPLFREVVTEVSTTSKERSTDNGESGDTIANLAASQLDVECLETIANDETIPANRSDRVKNFGLTEAIERWKAEYSSQALTY